MEQMKEKGREAESPLRIFSP